MPEHITIKVTADAPATAQVMPQDGLTRITVLELHEPHKFTLFSGERLEVTPDA